jgi:hypothetical protein
MKIQIQNSRELYRSVTTEYSITINGTNHIFRIHQNSQEGDLYWFDEEAFGSIEDYVLPGLTIEDILSWL